MKKSSETKSPKPAPAEASDGKSELATQLETLAALGATADEIMLVLGMTPEQLAAAEADPVTGPGYKRGRTIADQRVTESLYQNALHGNVDAQKFWLISRQPERWAGKVKQPKRAPEQSTAAEESTTPALPTSADPSAPPPHLGQAGRAHWQTVVVEFVIEAHDRPGLQIACEALDEIAELQVELQQAGDETAVEKIRRMISRARNDFRRSMRELGLNVESLKDSSPRPPGITGRTLRVMGA